MEYWRTIASRAWDESLQLVRWDNWPRIAVALLLAVVAFVLTWLALGDFAGSLVKALLSIVPTAIVAVIFFGIKMLTVPSTLHSEQQQRIEALEREQARLVESQKPRLEIMGLSQDQADPNRRWYLTIHNKSKTERVHKCGARIDEVVTIDGEPISAPLTLGTKSQLTEKREYGRFHMDPDDTKHIAICEPAGNDAFSCRLLNVQGASRKIARGKYRLKVKISSQQGTPIFASILIDQHSVQLETTSEA